MSYETNCFFSSLNSEVKSLQQGRSPSFKPEKHFFRQMRAMQSQFEESHISEHKQGDVSKYQITDRVGILLYNREV